MAQTRRGDRGSALMMALIVIIIMIGIAGTYLGLTMLGMTETAKSRDAAQASFLAEAAAGNLINALNMETPPNPLPIAPDPSLSNSDIRTNKETKWLGGWYLIETLDSGAFASDDYREYVVTAEYGKAQRRLQVIISRKAGGVFWNAIYAQNSSGSDNYNMVFGGPSANSKDVIRGDIYSGGKISTQGYSQLLNEDADGPSNQVMYASDDTDALTAGALQDPKPNFVNGTQPSLDIAGMNYDAKAAAAATGNTSDPNYDPKFINVKAHLDDNSLSENGFIKGETGPNQGCGIARQIKTSVGENDPAHIFRRNPKDNGSTDRVQSYSGMTTDKDDYFLEDSTRKQGNGSAQGNWLGSDGGQRINVQPGGNDKVYYIDGNLWASNSPAFTFQFENNTGDDMRITIVVKGNVYLTDNVLYDKLKNNDAMAIIAIKDEDHVNRAPEDYLPGGPYYNSSDFSNLPAGETNLSKAEGLARDYNKKSGSGNIFFGDPGGGTTERFESFLFAENNFYDNNLGASGTNKTNIYGNMTAGNHVQVTRKAGAFKPFDIFFDERLRIGKTSLPGIPGNLVEGGGMWRVLGWNTNPKSWKGGTINK